MKKRLFALFLACMMTFSLAACGGNKQETSATEKTPSTSAPATTTEKEEALPTYHFKFSIPQGEGDPAYIHAQKFIETVEAETNGNITFDFYPSGELGGMQDILEQVMRGSDIVTLTGADWMGSVVSDYAVTNPYIVDDPTQFAKLYASDWFQTKIDEAAGLGIRILDANWFAGYRSFLTTKPIESVSDLKGMKIRVLNNELLSNIMVCFGAVPVGLEQSESYSAMQNGLLDGIEGVPATLWSTKFYESGALYCTANHHSAAFCVCIINEEIFQGMPTEYQEILLKAAKECGESYTSVNIAGEEDYWKNLESVGVTVNRNPDLSTFKEATKAVPSMMPTWSDNVGEIMAEAVK